MEIRLGICTLRPWRMSDEQELVRHANNRNVWRNLRDAFPHPYGNLDAVTWLAKHIGVEAVRGISAYAFDTFPELVRIQAGVFEWNPASMRVLLKAGYEREAVLRQNIWKDGTLMDSVQYAKI